MLQFPPTVQRDLCYNKLAIAVNATMIGHPSF